MGSPTGVNPFSETSGNSAGPTDRKSTRLNSSHSQTSYAVFCLKKKRGTAARFIRDLSVLMLDVVVASNAHPLTGAVRIAISQLVHRAVAPPRRAQAPVPAVDVGTYDDTLLGDVRIADGLLVHSDVGRPHRALAAVPAADGSWAATSAMRSAQPQL